MYLGLLKEFLFHPDEEYIINRTLNVRGKDVLLLSLTKENDTCSLWVMRKRDLHEELYEVEVETKEMKCYAILNLVIGIIIFF